MSREFVDCKLLSSFSFALRDHKLSFKNPTRLQPFLELYFGCLFDDHRAVLYERYWLGFKFRLDLFRNFDFVDVKVVVFITVAWAYGPFSHNLNSHLALNSREKTLQEGFVFDSQ